MIQLNEENNDHHSHDEGYTMEDFVAWHNEHHTAEGYDIQNFMEWHDTLYANVTLESFLTWHNAHHEDHQPCNEC